METKPTGYPIIDDILESIVSSQSAPSSEEAWRYIADQRTVRSNYCIRQSGNGDCLAYATTKEIAAQIVRDHQLAALVPGLVKSLREVAIHSLRYCEEKYGHDDQARLNLEATLETVEVTIAIPTKEQK